MPLDSGTKLGPYEIQSPLGAGGMGEVYRARDTRLERIVALKVLPASFAADADRLHRFEREARSVAALSHPNILAVYDIGTHDGTPYMVTELLEGETLRERLQGGVVSARKAVEIAIQVAQGLAAAYDKGIIHRDLKPENIFLTKDGRVKILDFGLAKTSRSGSEAKSSVQTLTSADISLTEPVPFVFDSSGAARIITEARSTGLTRLPEPLGIVLNMLVDPFLSPKSQGAECVQCPDVVDENVRIGSGNRNSVVLR
jgi:serine/threonine protein kinase